MEKIFKYLLCYIVVSFAFECNALITVEIKPSACSYEPTRLQLEKAITAQAIQAKVRNFPLAFFQTIEIGLACLITYSMDDTDDIDAFKTTCYDKIQEAKKQHKNKKLLSWLVYGRNDSTK